MQITDGLLQHIPYHPSPNADERPAGEEINLLVIHNISLPLGEFNNSAIDDLFLNRLDVDSHPSFKALGLDKLHAASHAVIYRNGHIIQYVPFHRRAWHAGVSSYQGRKECNHFSIGIELEGTDDLPYEPVQYEQLTALTLALMEQYPGITPEHIVGHADIAPNRKTDPGPCFDWEHFMHYLNTELAKE